MQHRIQQTAVFKRQRTAHACDSCRARKSRCNGSKPVCNLCIEMDFECHYSGPTQRHVPPTSLSQRGQNATEFDRRLQTIEKALQTIIERSQLIVNDADGRDINPIAVALRAPHSPPNAVSSPEQALVITADVAGSQNGGLRLEEAIGEDVQMDAQGDTQVDAMDSVDGMGSIAFTDETQAGSFGPTSNSAYVPRLRTALKWLSNTGVSNSLAPLNASKSQYAISRPASPPPVTQPAAIQSQTEKRSQRSELPSHAEASSLVDIFFRNSGQLFPYLSRIHIHDCLSRVARSPKYHLSRCEFCILLMVLAFATSVNPNSVVSMRGRAKQADAYCRRAKTLLSTHEKDSAGIYHVQAWLLVAQYTQGTQKSGETWNLLGRVINLAMKVGIHREKTFWRLSPREAESYRRTWWMCFMMDRIQSMTLGRPPLLPNSHMIMDLPSNVDLDTLEHNVCVNAGDAQPMAIEATTYGDLFRTSLQLYLILGDIIQTIFSNNLDSVEPKLNWTNLQKIFNFEERLSRWRQDLPETLRDPRLESPRPEVSDLSSCGMKTILWLRYHSVRTILHRFVLEGLLDDVAGDASLDYVDQGNVEDQLIKMSLHICVTSALETLSIIQHLSKTKDAQPAWWFSIYYTFTSALTILGGVLVKQMHPIVLPSYHLATLTEGAKTAFGLLQVIGEDTSLGKRCLKFLTKMTDSVLSVAQNQGKMQSKQTPDEDARMAVPTAVTYSGAKPGNASTTRQVEFDLTNISGNAIMTDLSPFDMGDCSSVDIDIGPFFLDEDFNDFLSSAP